MADQQQLERLEQGVEVWNQWRKEYPDEDVDLSRANLKRANLSYANLSEADLSFADLSWASLSRANLRSANLSMSRLFGVRLDGADLKETHFNSALLLEAYFFAADLSGANLNHANLDCANLSHANLSGANLNHANLTYANLREANLSGTNLGGANLDGAVLIETNLQGAILSNCHIYGISAWNVRLEKTEQQNLTITSFKEKAIITVDDLEVAQFIYLMLNNQKIRQVIDSITSKAVLILGRFTPERKAVLDTLRETLRQYNYLPILFDFEKPSDRDLTETVSTLAHLARFIIVDLTDPSSAPHELATVIPHCIVPVQPLLLLDKNEREYSMFRDLRQRYHWVLPTYRYTDIHGLLASLQENVIAPAEEKAKELEKR